MQEYYYASLKMRDACPFLFKKGFRTTDPSRESIRVCLSCPLKDGCVFDYSKQEQVKVKREILERLWVR